MSEWVFCYPSDDGQIIYSYRGFEKRLRSCRPYSILCGNGTLLSIIQMSSVWGVRDPSHSLVETDPGAKAEGALEAKSRTQHLFSSIELKSLPTSCKIQYALKASNQKWQLVGSQWERISLNIVYSFPTSARSWRGLCSGLRKVVGFLLSAGCCLMTVCTCVLVCFQSVFGWIACISFFIHPVGRIIDW